MIEADLHTHSIASTHAYSTIKENAESASKAGLKAFAITDHAPEMADAPHIWHFHNFRVLPRFMFGVRLIFGIEENIIDTEGTLMLDEYSRTHLDWVVASIHMELFKPTTVENHTRAYIQLAKCQPVVDCIGHPTNINFPFEIEKVIKTFKEYDKIVEINEAHLRNYKKSHTLAKEIIAACKKYEVSVCVNSDAHYCDHVGQFPVSLAMLEDFPKDLIFNADIDRVLERISRKTFKRTVDI
ncbi:putative phosphatase [Clostridia bacterium]|nr:putative phosphatase [Clostridia bacterium]